jgi:2,3-bisphosphoglycerate-independent phosphoglycerate mutase
MSKKAMLIILDGYGINKNREGNAILQTDTPFLDSLFAQYPHCELRATGRDVGLPEGIMGNSEVGHLNIGAGRVVYQLNTLIDHKIEIGEFFQNPALLAAINHAKQYKSKLHLWGLLSSGGVHSSLNHLEALLELCRREDFSEVYYHAFMDGRDTLPNDGVGFMTDYMEKVKIYGRGDVATISGRYYGMDRDNRWERVQEAYDMLVSCIGKTGTCPIQIVEDSYKSGDTDEFIKPTLVYRDGKPVALVEDGDAVIFFNFRSDRPREIMKSFIYDDFSEFPVKKFNNLHFTTMTEYDKNFNDFVSVAFRLDKLDNILGKVLADKGLSQLRLAETEKYAHVTFFFNGGVEEPFPNEERILINSPKIASYDLQPEMSAFILTETYEYLEKDFDVVIINYANCDMVGHTGKFDAVQLAVETVDKCLSRIIPLAIKKGYNILVTADHGNAEQMLDDKGNVMTAHSMNPVPLILIPIDTTPICLEDGILADIAPTLLHVIDVNVPNEMTGRILISGIPKPFILDRL